MIKRLFTGVIILTLGVILGFSILIAGEKNTRSEDDTAGTLPHRKSPLARIAELRVEVARLESRLAQHHQSSRPVTGPSIDTLPPRARSLPSPTSGDPQPLALRTPTTPVRPAAKRDDTPFLPAPSGLASHTLVQGQVMDDSAGKPVKSFTLGIRRHDAVWVRKQVRHRKGRFLWQLDPGRISMFVQVPGFLEWRRDDIDLLAGSTLPISVRLVAEDHYEGHIIDAETDLPLAGAILTHTTGNWTATTDSNGFFSGANPFRGRDPRARRLQVAHNDYVTLHTTAPQHGPITLRLHRGAAALIGVVRTAADKPLYGAVIRVIKDDTFNPEAKTATTNMEGEFRVGGLTPGRFLVWASARRFPGAVRIVDLAAGETGQTAFRFRAGLALKGRIKRPTDPDTPLLVQAYDASGGFLMEVPASRDNTFLLENLAPGSYTLKVFEKQSGALLKTFEVEVPHTDGEVTLNI